MIQLLLAYLVKAAFVFAFAALLVRLARRFAAATRHGLRALAAAAVLLLLPLSFVLPRVPLGVGTSGAAGLAVNLLILLWLAVAAVLTARILLDRRALRRVTAAGDPSDARLSALVRDAAVSMCVERPVRLREWRGSMPATFGTLRPTILLPAAWRDWPHERLKLVLAHEMGHIARHDAATLLVARAAAAVHWFNPLAWRTLRNIRIECEEACDERVLRAGADPSAYAHVLLDAMRDHTVQPAPAAALAMISTRDLESRLRAILSGRRDRRDRRVAVILLAALIAAAALLLGPLSLDVRPYADVPASTMPA